MSSGETWYLNEILLDPYFEATINFVSNSESFSNIAYVVTPDDGLQYDGTFVNNSGGWTNTAYRTITFATPPTGDLLTWLQANGVKQ